MSELGEIKGPPAANESQALDIWNKSVVVSSIVVEKIDLYQEAGRRSGFDIEVVAEEGEYYLTGKAVNVLEASENAANADEFRRALIVQPVVSDSPVARGRVAISIQKPAFAPDHTSFYEALESIQ